MYDILARYTVEQLFKVPIHPSQYVPNEYIHDHSDDTDHTTENHTTNHMVPTTNSAHMKLAIFYPDAN